MNILLLQEKLQELADAGIDWPNIILYRDGSGFIRSNIHQISGFGKDGFTIEEAFADAMPKPKNIALDDQPKEEINYDDDLIVADGPDGPVMTTLEFPVDNFPPKIKLSDLADKFAHQKWQEDDIKNAWMSMSAPLPTPYLHTTKTSVGYGDWKWQCPHCNQLNMFAEESGGNTPNHVFCQYCGKHSYLDDTTGSQHFITATPKHTKEKSPGNKATVILNVGDGVYGWHCPWCGHYHEGTEEDGIGPETGVTYCSECSSEIQLI